MHPFFVSHPDSVALWPCLGLTLGHCECCDKIGGIALHLDFLIWSVGIEVPFFTH